MTIKKLRDITLYAEINTALPLLMVKHFTVKEVKTY